VREQKMVCAFESVNHLCLGDVIFLVTQKHFRFDHYFQPPQTSEIGKTFFRKCFMPKQTGPKADFLKMGHSLQQSH
jgi:hypothetical protein